MEQPPNPTTWLRCGRSLSCRAAARVPSSNGTWLLKDLSNHPPNMAARISQACRPPRPTQPRHGWPASSRPPPFHSTSLRSPHDSGSPLHSMPAPAFIWRKGATHSGEASVPTALTREGMRVNEGVASAPEQKAVMCAKPG